MKKRSSLAARLGIVSLPICLFAWNSAIAAITIDGDASDWTTADRIDATPVSGYKLSGRYENNAYKILLQADNQIIGPATTIWLDTDQKVSTGYQVFGFTGGAEYNINFYTDGKPYLYTGADGENYVSGPLNYKIVTSGTSSTLEMEIPENLIGTPANGINLMLDVNDTVFLPTYYSTTNQYVLPKQTTTPPTPIGNTDRRIGIVYSQTTANRFWDPKSYSQLFMSVQAQAMMAGIPFDVLSETDLTDLNKVTQYDTLVFPYFAYVPDAIATTIEQNLVTASTKNGVGIIAAGNFMTNKADGSGMAGDAYSRMKTLLGVDRVDGVGPVNMAVKISNVTHPAFKGEYTSGENVLNYTGAYTDYFAPSGNGTTTVLATQTIGSATQNAVIASEIGGRNMHFATVGMLADANMLWSALRWSVYGSTPLAGVQLGRQKALFIGRNDMDISRFTQNGITVDTALYNNYLTPWKTKYNFVGSYYINIGNNPAGGEAINWTLATPLYQKYIAAGNEIGTHSYTHPGDTNVLNATQIKFEFGDARTLTEQKLGLTNLSGAVPGAPENLQTAQEIIKYVTYLSGGYAGIGAGFPNAIGYMTPQDTKVYLSPNMSFDYTLIEFNKLNATQAQAQWFSEFDNLVKHAKLPMIHWPWHDYGPVNPNNLGYTAAMFENLISKASTYGSEFTTGKDLSNRITALHNAKLDVSQPNSTTVNVNLQSTDAGRFAIDIPQASNGQKIKSVNSWYAYNDNQVFTDKDAGAYTVNLGTAADAITHITQLPARANLVSLTGNGEDLSFSIEGEGSMTILTKCNATPTITGASSSSFNATTKTATLKFTPAKTYNVALNMTCP